MLHRVCLVAARSSNRRHFETHQPLAEAAGRSSRSFRYRCVVSSVQAFLSLYCSFQISYPGLGCPSLFGNQRSKPGSYSLSTLVSFPVSILSLRYYKSTASPSLLGRPSLASHSVLEPFDPPHRDPFFFFSSPLFILSLSGFPTLVSSGFLVSFGLEEFPHHRLLVVIIKLGCRPTFSC